MPLILRLLSFISSLIITCFYICYNNRMHAHAWQLQNFNTDIFIRSYALQAAGLDLKENLGAGAAAAWPYPSVYHPYDAAFASYPFNG